MSEWIELFLRAALVENLALSFFLGMCMFLAVSERLETALGFGAVVFAVQSITVPLNHLIHANLLRRGAWAWAGLPEVDLGFLGLVSFVGVIAAFVQILEMALDRHAPALAARLGVYLPLVTVNCAILGGSLFMAERRYSLAESAVYGAGSGFGWALALCLLAAIREKLRYSDAPEGLRGMGLTFVVAGLMSLAFLGFAGIELG
ncbi:MAG: NADH:ubiquinone reductase (Na(+)-transporting) subunit E [Myxococcales bacterium]|nr:NADH:ubiquinone reductase (Na(+)-transporting) subunit E [Myxococcales bacterium]